MKKVNRIKRLLVIQCMLLLVVFACEKQDDDSQSPMFESNLELKSYKEVITKINSSTVECTTFVALPDGSSILVNHANNDDISIKKIDNDGKEIWDLIYGKPDGMIINVGQIIQASDGSFIFTGGAENESHNMDILLLKISSDGKLSWEKTYDINEWETCYSVYETNDGGFILTGASGQKYAVVKTTASGELTWAKTFGEKSDNSIAWGGIELSDENYLVTGAMDNKGIIHKIGKEGSILWQKNLPDHYTGVDIIAGNDSGFIILADYYNPSDSTKAVSLIKIDEDGNIIWKKDHLKTKETIFAELIRKIDVSGYFVVIEKEDDNGNVVYSVLKFDNDGNSVE